MAKYAVSALEPQAAGLCIDRFELELPASLGGRKHAIMRLLRAELSRKAWPSGAIGQLQLPIFRINSQQTNLAIARALADGFFKAVVVTLSSSGRAAIKNTPKPKFQRGEL